MSEWMIAALGEVLTRVKRPVKVAPDVVYRTLGVRWYGAGCFLKDGKPGSEIAAPTLYGLQAGDVVYSRLFAWKGSFGVVGLEHADGVASNEFPTFRASAELLPEYFAVWSARHDIWSEANDGSSGTTANSRNRLGEAEFLALEIELPPPDEQRKIVEIVDALDIVIARTAEEHAASTALLQAARLELFSSRGDEIVKRLGNLARVTTGGTPSRQRPEYFNGDIPWVKTGEVAFHEITETAEHISDDALKNSSAKLFPSGTVVVAMYGQGATRGRCAILRREMATNQACAAVLPSDALEPRYLFHWLWSRYDEIRAEGLGSSQPNLTKTLIENLELPVPPRREQAQMVSTFDALLEAVDALRAELDALRALRDATVEDLVSGARTVRGRSKISDPSAGPGAELSHEHVAA